MPPRQRRGLAPRTVIGSIPCFSCGAPVDVLISGAEMAYISCPHDHPENPYQKCGFQARWGRVESDRMIDTYEASQNVRDTSEPGSEVRSDPVSDKVAEPSQSERAGEVGPGVGTDVGDGSENVGTDVGTDVGDDVGNKSDNNDGLW